MLLTQLFVRIYAMQYVLLAVHFLLFAVQFLRPIALQLPNWWLLDWWLFHRRLCNGVLWRFADAGHEHCLPVWVSSTGSGRLAADVLFESPIRCC